MSAATPETKTIDIGVCTFRRPQLAATLKSLGQLNLPSGYAFRVIVADNDDTPSAQALVAKSASIHKITITYIHAPARNISIARNACLAAATASLFVFIDDDEEASPEWLNRLVDQITSSGADVVLGPVKALYDAASPRWIRQGDFHSIKPVWVNGNIITGYTSNVMFRPNSAAFQNKFFETELGQTGGEDTCFFTEAYKAGAVFTYAPDAIVTEFVPNDRASFKWLFKRRYRSGQTHGQMLKQEFKNFVDLPRCVAITAGKALACIIGACVSIPNVTHITGWLFRGALHCGVLSSLFGARRVTIYGGTNAP